MIYYERTIPTLTIRFIGKQFTLDSIRHFKTTIENTPIAKNKITYYFESINMDTELVDWLKKQHIEELEICHCFYDEEGIKFNHVDTLYLPQVTIKQDIMPDGRVGTYHFTVNT